MARLFPKHGLAAAGLAAALLASTIAAESAATRGGKMVYGRYADSLFLDPVLNDANVDIWVLTNLYDTLLSPTQDGQGVQPGLPLSGNSRTTESRLS